MSQPFRLLMPLALALAATSAQASLITQPIDEQSLVTLEGNTRPEATPANDRGALPGNTQLDHMHLQLRRDAAGDKAAADFLAAQYDPRAPEFHQWLSPEEFGARFGLAQADLDQITAWLAAHGLTVNAVLPNRLVIDFSGTAAQVADAFHTELHRIVAHGVSHISNMNDPRIPAALAPAIAGVVSLNDFRAQGHYQPRTPGPRLTNAGSYPLVPEDLSQIYNFNSAFNAQITGDAQTIAAVEPTDLYSNADWTNFRKILGISNHTNGSLTVVHPSLKGVACADPGVTNADGEATLDVEWASAAAPAAKIRMVACASTQTTDGVYLASQIEVNGPKPPPIITVSYGICETSDGAAQNKAFASLWQQAAAEGISVFVATGDNGPSDCAASGMKGATVGIDANGWASTNYNVSVGGTDFDDTATSTVNKYWKQTNVAASKSAWSYIPEIPWNGNCASTILAKFNGVSQTYGATGFCNVAAGAAYTGLVGGEGAPSLCATGTPSTQTGAVNGTCAGTPKPSWQSGVVGIPADGVRDTPDVSLFAAAGTWNHYYVTCFSDPNGGGPCTGNPGNWAGGGGGTSYATPIWAGIQALINEKVGKRQGNPNPVLYTLAAKDYASGNIANCNSSTRGRTTSCVFNNITVGDDNSDCVAGSPNCYTPSGKLGVLSTSTTSYKPAYVAGPGYSLAVGLGTVDVFNLINAWPVK